MILARPWAACLAFFTLIVAPPSLARVFWLQGGGPHGDTAAGRPGWNRAYAAELRINGGRADLDVIGCQMSASDAERMLLAAYNAAGGRAWASHGMDLGWGLATVGPHVVRWLIFSAGRSEECIVVRITQTRHEFLASGRPPAGTGIEALPPLPGADVRLLIADDTARAALDVLETRQSPAAALRSMGDALMGGGWVPAMPTGPDDAPTLFRRERDVCAISAVPGEAGGARLVRLHKRMAARVRP